MVNKTSISRKKETCTVFISKELHAVLKDGAKKDRRTIGTYTAILLEEALKARE